MSKRFIIIDGNSLVHRAFHALPPLSTAKGRLVNAAYGFITILLRVLKEFQPEYAAVAFDLPKPTFRHALFKEYKAQRVKQPQELYDQIPIIQEILQRMGIPVFEKAGFEADDLIATLTRKANKEAAENIIITGDLDTLQLVDKGTKVYTLKKGIAETAVYDEKAVMGRYGLAPRQLVDYKALRGDPSDNIPGVRGIGEKSAGQLIQTFGSIEKLYQHLKECKEGKTECQVKEKTKELLLEQEEAAFLGKQLVILKDQVPVDFSLEDCRFKKKINREELEEIFQELEFKKLLPRLDELGLENKQAVNDPNREKFAYQAIKETVVLNKKILESKEVAISFSLSSYYPLNAKLTALALTTSQENFFFSLDGEKEIKQLTFLENPSVIKWTHDVKAFLEGLANYQAKAGPIYDTMIAAYLLNPGSRAYDLETLSSQVLKTKPTQLVLETKIDPEHLVRHAALIFELKDKLSAELKSQGLTHLYQNIETPLIPVMIKMEQAGVKIDKQLLIKLSQEFAKKLDKISKKIYQLAEREFNISSPVQLREVLFEKMKIVPLSEKGRAVRIRKTEGGEISTAASELEKLRGSHPIIDLIFEHRELAKLKSTYTDALVDLINKETGRLHTTFNQAVTATGRLSSSNPNLQNIPIRTETGREIRKAFVAEQGFVLLSADYSQIELRLAASLSGDLSMIQAFKAGEDFHAKTAALVSGLPLEEVTAKMRYAAKAVNFGVLYGMGPSSLAEATNLSRAEAEDFIFKYFQTFKQLRIFLDGLIEQARNVGFVETLFGRRRYLPEISSGVPQARAAAERMALNHPIQGSAADLIKMAMIEVDKNIRMMEYGNNLKMVLQVHDELVFEVKKDIIDKVALKIKEIMENVYALRAPLVADVKVGKNWGEMKMFRI